MLGLGKKLGRPRKSLDELIEDGSFLARRHAELLAGELVDDPTLAALQQLFRQAGDDGQRKRVALQFERLVRESREAEASADTDVEPAVEFEEPVSVPESPSEMMARIWGVPRVLAWWERDALGIPPSEDYWAWSKRVKGF